MNSRSERSIFMSALDRATPAERAAFLGDACGADTGLRRRVEQLLRSHDDAGSFMAAPAAAELETVPGLSSPLSLSAAAAAPPAESPGGRIGPYKLLQKIGEGGMGVVYMADQEAPVRRRVALKVIRPGMDSAQVIARFEAERQALALMDHPNIARVLDAGTTDAGRPYFVMELVHGVPLTNYCDEARLGLRERLGLFVQVCAAVQHAHQKGIIHRDIKPGNVMVTVCDGKPLPKVIDFGIAKAVGEAQQRLTERTLFTHFGMMAGTLEYMSPEQAAGLGAAVDTRGDVYSLGVLLYELLTGSTPLERARLREAAFADVLRRIREEEPPRPSTRLGASGEMRAAISNSRGTDPLRLTRLLRGELDWIVMKCLEKDRARRYETVNGLARDVERYLADEPVAAGPPGARYRLRKFARRNKALLAATSAVAAALLLGTALATYGLVEARRDRAAAVDARAAEARERRAAEDAKVLAQGQRAAAEASAAAAKREAVKSAAVSRFLREMLASAGPGGPGEFNPTVREALDRAVKELDDGKLAAHGDVEAAVRQTIGSAYASLGQFAAAQVQLDAALALQKQLLGPAHPDVAATLHAMGYLARGRRWWGTAAGHFREALAIRRQAFGGEHELVAATLAELADSVTRDAVVRGVSLDEANALNEQAAALVRKVSGERSARAAGTLQSRAVVLSAKRDWPGAEALYREARSIYQEVHGERHIGVAHTTFMLALCRVNQGDDAGAEPLLRQAVKGYAECLGPEHPSIGGVLDHLRRVLARRGDPGAAAVGMEWLRVEVARLTAEMKALPDDAKLAAARAPLLTRLGRFAESTADWEQAARLDPDNFHARFCAAIGLLHGGDAGAHRAYARAMMEGAPKSAEGSAYEWAAKVCLLSPPPGRAEVEAAMRFVDRDLATRNPKTSASKLGWAELTKAMAEYRAGDFGACLAWVGRYRVHAPKINYGDPRYHEGLSLALAAMALHGLGEPDDARWCVDESARLMARCPQPGQADLGEGPENWQMWAILLREARDVVARGPAATARPSTASMTSTAGPHGGARRRERVAARIQVERLKNDVARLTAELKARPGNVRLVHERAVLNGRLGRFAESTADWEAKIKLNPDNWPDYFAAAVGRLHQGDVEGYRAHARAMMGRFANLGDWASQERLAKTYALAPPPRDVTRDLATAMRLIDQALLDRARDERNHAWLQNTKALVEYRAGNVQACLDWTIKSRANNPKVMVVDRRYPYGVSLALAAMAHHRLGHPAEARQALAAADRLMDEVAQPGRGDLGAGQEDWQVWAVLLREARELIAAADTAGDTPPARAAARPGDPDAERIGAAQIELLEAEVARLTGELKARPDDPGLAHHRAILYGHLGRFRESLADQERTLTLDPDHCDARFSAAVAQLYLGDVEGSRAQARDMMQRFAGRGDAGVKDRVAKTFLLNPPPGGSEADVAAAARLIEQAMNLPHEDPVTPFLEMTKALAEYRSGRFEACLEWVERSRSHPVVWGGDRRKPEGTCLALAAMAQHRLGRADEAASSLAGSERLLDESPKPGKADLGDGPNNRLVWEIILREARGLVDPGGGEPSR